jgi:4-hydroxymandelate oxidase
VTLTSVPQLETLSLRELEPLARRYLDPAVYDFFAGGADDEVTLRANESAFGRLTLRPRVLRGLPAPDLRTRLLGSDLELPVYVAPTAFQGLAHPDGEVATARAAAASGALMMVAMASTVAVEELADKPAPVRWFQLTIQPDLGFTQHLVQRAERAGCTALVVAVDVPVPGRRERDLRNGFAPDLRCENLRDPSSGEIRRVEYTAQLGWEHLEWLRRATALPIVLKGVTHPEDARLAVGLGVDALVVSNHGGRQLDTMPAAIELLPDVAEAVGGAVPVLLDGGVRRGTDVLKALALGATAVGLGRPVLWGLAAAGEQGVTRVLELIRDELSDALTLCGHASVTDLPGDLVGRLP